MSTSNLIETYKVSPELCDSFIKYHKKNKEYKGIGMNGNGEIDKNIKDSTDVLFYNESTDKTILKFFQNLSKYVQEYINKYNIISNLITQDCHLIQHYKKGGGYFKTHYERSDIYSIRRELVYMLYCNDVEKGGTYFPLQKKELQCKKGDLIIWPAFFTHPHRGVISTKQEKYIVTGWFQI
tara:strand:+ start:69 stop:611 length:543 start_codon:yes stop_codon:yes gene_type:complete